MYPCRHIVIPANTPIIVKIKKGSIGWHASTSRNTARGILIPALVVEADNSHRVDVVLAACRRMYIPKRQKINYMMSSVILAKLAGDLPHTNLLSGRRCREGTQSEVQVDLDVTYVY